MFKILTCFNILKYNCCFFSDEAASPSVSIKYVFKYMYLNNILVITYINVIALAAKYVSGYIFKILIVENIPKEKTKG